MILGNYSVYLKSPGSFRAGTSISDNHSNYDRTNANRNRFLHFSPYNGEPVGYGIPYSWQMPQKAGGMSTSNGLDVSISNTANLAGGLNGDAAITGTLSTTNAVAQLIVDVQASLSGTGTLTDAGANTLANFSATILSSLTTTSAILEAIQVLDAVAALSAQGLLTPPILGALLGTAASLTATISTSSTLSGIGSAESDIGGAEPLSPQGLAQELLDNQDIETGYSMRESLKLILAALAGKVSGGGGATISIRDINDTVDRIVATVDGNGNRLAVTKDLT